MPTCISDEMVIQIIEKGISSLGEAPTQTTWLCLERDFKFNKRTVSENLGEFQEALQKLFGKASDFLDALFRDYLSEATGENLSKYPSFADCVAALRQKNRTESRLTDSANEPVIATRKAIRVIGKAGEANPP